MHFFIAGAYDLKDHLTGLSPCPSPFIFVKNETDTGTIKQSNLDYHLWKHCDKLLLSWLLASILESMFHVARCVTACDVWKALQSYFVTKSKVRVVHLKNTLQTLKKGLADISSYIKKMRELANALKASG